MTPALARKDPLRQLLGALLRRGRSFFDGHPRCRRAGAVFLRFLGLRAVVRAAGERAVIAAGAVASAPAPCVRDVVVGIGGKRYTITSDDIYLDHFRDGFEPDLVRLFQTVASDSDVILDIGANVGCTALLFGELARTVHAFEPSPSTFAFLERNIAGAGLKNVRAHHLGLGAERSESTLTFAPLNRSGGFVSNLTHASAGHTVETIEIRPLDEVLGALGVSRVDFVKIDVEGFEGQVLRGARQTLATHRPVVALELNHWCLNAFQRTSIPEHFDFLCSVFPILLAVDGASYLDLHDEGERYTVMYQHIVHLRFGNILAAFDEGRLARFRVSYHHGFSA